MAAAMHMVGSAHSSASSSPISPPQQPWHPVVVLAPNHQHQATASSPARHNHLGPAPTRRAGKRRRPRPSRKLPTTYISADAASFRRMVHQVTGAADDVAYRQATETELLCRPAPAPAPPSRRAALTTTTNTLALLPTLDTSAFLLGAAARGGGTTTPARPAGASCCPGGSAVVALGDPGAALQAEEACGGGEEYRCSNGSGGGGEFPSLEPWDDDALF